MSAAVLLVLGVATAAVAAESRFFVAGSGALEVVNPVLNERVAVRYRRDDGQYDYAAFEQIRHIMRSKGDGLEGEITPRFVELLGYLHTRSGRPLRLLSGYRSPGHNEGLRRRGTRAAPASLHTEGLAADVAFPPDELRPLWLHLRELGCCGVGLYGSSLHVDVGTPRFWQAATSRADENLRAGNARVFARADFDRYTAGEMMLVRLHAVTLPPLRIERTARLVTESGESAAIVTVEDVSGAAGTGCIAADGATRLLVKGAPAITRGRVVLTTCEPRLGRTPERVETNPVTLR